MFPSYPRKDTRERFPCPYQLVGNLKKAIKADNPQTFASVDAKDIQLWKVEIGGDHLNNQLKNLKLNGSDELSAINEIGDYWTKKPPKKHIYVLVKLPTSRAANRNYSTNSVHYMHYSTSLLKWMKCFKWTVNIKHVTLDGLKEHIRGVRKTPALDNGGAELSMLNDVFPPFTCEYKELKEDSSKAILKHLTAKLNARLKAIPISGNEASKSQYVCSYLVSGINLYEGNCENFGVTKVKDKDIFKGIAQNAIQFESALSNRKRKANEMEEESVFTSRTFGITDAKEWYFMKCLLDDQDRLRFKLLKPVTVVYDSENMGGNVERVLEHIAWRYKSQIQLHKVKRGQ
ncbi:hypothetical protein GLOIN_2v1658885 [Rhizophagus irregularis DAOM 181602=DAOM 197198]|nr:hypothetical protein GLOIN_2v1658885 [Rhizophagus irregularis DAOM 181602=DAOM 197198]